MFNRPWLEFVLLLWWSCSHLPDSVTKQFTVWHRKQWDIHACNATHLCSTFLAPACSLIAVSAVTWLDHIGHMWHCGSLWSVDMWASCPVHTLIMTGNVECIHLVESFTDSNILFIRSKLMKTLGKNCFDWIQRVFVLSGGDCASVCC